MKNLMKLGDKSIRPEEKIIRIYPQKNLFSHIIGQIDDEIMESQVLKNHSTKKN